MARKSRRTALTDKKTENETLYRTAIYARLSIENNGISGDSIENQLAVVKQFIKERPDLRLIRTFIDNGESGTHFERPGFRAMLDAVRKGEINCIVVKDLSRFGRNYLETGGYLERLFPCLGVRFLSVNDNYDSLHSQCSDAFLIPLKAVLHDIYAKDISKKICASLDIRKKSGSFLGNIPPYGYMRDSKDRHKLAVHPERAGVVRQIFQWKLSGDGPAAIARRLNENKIPTQLNLRFQEGYPNGREDAVWHGSTVAAILKNPCYIGCTVERKSSRAFYQGKQRLAIPEEKWKLIENTHEAIISRGDFEKVRELARKGQVSRG